ncbi:hypothetical protein CN918_29975 [Priestia megaterium]|nr:hypothetical protein CN918_29975 [Priestia megaterium]
MREFEEENNQTTEATSTESSTPNKKTTNQDESYFCVINTAEKAYWLGYVFANGELKEYDQFQKLLITTGNDGKQQLQKLPKILFSEAVATYGEFQLWHLETRDEIVINALLRHGMEEGTNKNLQLPPTLSFRFLKPFIIGYFDGKGTLTTSPDKVSIAGPLSFLKELKETIEDEIKISFKVQLLADGGTLLNITKSRDILLFLHWMYAEEPFGLPENREIHLNLLQAFEALEQEQQKRRKKR